MNGVCLLAASEIIWSRQNVVGSLDKRSWNEETENKNVHTPQEYHAQESALSTSPETVARNSATVESLGRKRRASPRINEETNATSISSVTTSPDNTEEDIAKKARIFAEASNVASVNHVPTVAHRTIDPAAFALPGFSRGMLVLPGSQQPTGLRHPLLLGANSTIQTPNGIIPGSSPGLSALQAASAASMLQLQANPQASVLSLQSQTPAATSMTSAATASFYTNGVPGHQVINSAGKPVNMTYHTQKDTTFTKIFVGGLPYHTTDASLRKFFEQFGEIEEAVVITDRLSSCSKGYGFVTMVDKYAAERACKDGNPVIDGRKANVNLAYIGAKPRNIPTATAGAVIRPGAAYQYAPQPLTMAQQPFGVAGISPYYAGPTYAVTPSGVLVQTHSPYAQTPIIDYGGSTYATGLSAVSPFAQDIAASVGAAQYQTAAVQAPHHLTAAHPAYTATLQAATMPGGYPTAHGYPAVSLQQHLATTQNPAYAQLTAQLQANERLGLANQ